MPKVVKKQQLSVLGYLSPNVTRAKLVSACSKIMAPLKKKVIECRHKGNAKDPVRLLEVFREQYDEFDLI